MKNANSKQRKLIQNAIFVKPGEPGSGLLNIADLASAIEFRDRFRKGSYMLPPDSDLNPELKRYAGVTVNSDGKLTRPEVFPSQGNGYDSYVNSIGGFVRSDTPYNFDAQTLGKIAVVALDALHEKRVLDAGKFSEAARVLATLREFNQLGEAQAIQRARARNSAAIQESIRRSAARARVEALPPRYVIGPDMDLHLVKTLIAGDQVLMEINGVRYWSPLTNPMVAEHPWEVLENTAVDRSGRAAGRIVLRHPKVQEPFVLDYDDLLETERPEGGKMIQPAVWATTNPRLQEGVLYVFLQMVAYRLPEDRVERDFSSKFELSHFTDALQNERDKETLLKDWSKAFSPRVDEKGWHLTSIKRLALRAQVRTTVVRALRTGDLEGLLRVSDGDLLSLRRECHWVRHLGRQNDLIAHDPDRVFIK
jgi:hypothetical protein